MATPPVSHLAMHPYRANETLGDAPKPPKSKLPWILLVAGALHAAVLGAGALAHPAATASATEGESPRTSTVTVLGGHVDEATGDVALSGYQLASIPARR